GIGASVVAVRPGAGTSLDPFAVTDGSPGALSVRVATLTTLLDLLAGGLRPAERAAVEAAVSLAYAKAGFTDGKPTTGLVPPRLAHVQLHLRAHQGMEGVCSRLERYVSGAGSWLLRRAELAENEDGNVAYVLAGLPEEERAAAMFRVLERLWRALRDSV